MEKITTVLCCHKQKCIYIFLLWVLLFESTWDYWLSYVRQTRSNVCLQLGLWLPFTATLAKHSAHLTPTTTDVLAVCVMEPVQSTVDTKHLCVLLKGLKQPSPVSFGSSDIISWYCNPNDDSHDSKYLFWVMGVSCGHGIDTKSWIGIIFKTYCQSFDRSAQCLALQIRGVWIQFTIQYCHLVVDTENNTGYWVTVTGSVYLKV